VIVEGLLTVEEILRPSWIVRRRIDDKSLTSPFVWVATIAHGKADGQCVIKGHVARNGHSMDASDILGMRRICEQLEFTSGGYDRVHESGKLKVSRKREKSHNIV
jgi:hypothetical protein